MINENASHYQNRTPEGAIWLQAACSTNGANFKTGDPRLGSLAENGGATRTFALLSDSPAIDAGDAATCAAAPVNGDYQRREARDDYQCDLGAFELKYADSDTVTRVIEGAGTYTFGPTMVKVVVDDAGGCLTGITVQRTDADHPNATAALRTGRWWRITPGPAECTGYGLDLTLPADFAPDAIDQVCRYTGSGTAWECAMDSFNETSLTRHGVTVLSDWAAANNFLPAVAPAVSARASGGDVLLSWEDLPANGGGYIVWYSASPYFLPGDPGMGSALLPAGSTSWTHAGAAGDPAHNHYYYVVQGVNGAGSPSGLSNRTGAFSYPVTPGAAAAR